jgi:rhamnulokinase
MSEAYIAIDLGAESGRVIAVGLGDHRISLHELHRFANQPVALPSGLHWDITSLWREIVAGLTKAAAWGKEAGVRLVSVGVDAWGVDWGLLGESGELIGLPHAYRDDRYPQACEAALQRVSVDEIYERTGIQLMPINTIFSLFAQTQSGPEVLESAAQLAFIPDLFHFWLSGRRAIESTIASTSQLIDVRTGQWAWDLIKRLGLPANIFSETRGPGTVLGKIRPALARATGLPEDLQVVLPASHDTASAVAAVPAIGAKSWCYLSSGTWSLLGAEIEAPCVTSAARDAMFTNELGVGGKIRFLKNIAGLWLVQELRRDLAAEGQDFDYAQLTKLAEQAPAHRAIVDANHPSFQQPGGIRAKIKSLCEDSGQVIPNSPGEFARCCLESLAVAYQKTFAKLRQVLNRDFEVVHVVGGGGQNRLLCQMTADALNRTVVVGPLEATAIGNGLMQAIAVRRIADLRELRHLVASSVELQTYEAVAAASWNRLTTSV